MATPDAKLRRYYHRWNARYFEGRLPEDVEFRWEADADYENCGTARLENGKGFIHLNPALHINFAQVLISLAHEMIHLLLWPYRRHGKRFNAEVARLVLAGMYKGLL